ncbi:MAG: ATP-binding protein, partial [Pseudomonadota bacterium]
KMLKSVELPPAGFCSPFATWTSCAKTKSGEVIGLLCEATNITELRKLELDLRRSNKDLEQFAYVASHDLKAPLRAIEVIVSWLKEDLADYDEGDVKENLDLLTQRTGRLARLLDDLLAYSRAGRKVGQISTVDSTEVVKDIVNLIAPEDSVKINISDELPTLVTYSAPMEQVLRNLISNAIKHHPGPNIEIQVGCEEADEFYLFSVADNGTGIPQDYADRIFQMFQTLKPRDDVEGSGMGLAIVARIVEWQGGRVWYEEPESGTGTVFKFQWQKQSMDENTQEQVA